ncbi:putative lipoprotein [Leptospira interrogans str. L0996]|nr:putative lipoprotein [Leptospira interrogans str. L0996]
MLKLSGPFPLVVISCQVPKFTIGSTGLDDSDYDKRTR